SSRMNKVANSYSQLPQSLWCSKLVDPYRVNIGIALDANLDEGNISGWISRMYPPSVTDKSLDVGYSSTFPVDQQINLSIFEISCDMFGRDKIYSPRDRGIDERNGDKESSRMKVTKDRTIWAFVSYFAHKRNTLEHHFRNAHRGIILPLDAECSASDCNFAG